MANTAQHSPLASRNRPPFAAFALALICTLTVLAMESLPAQTFTVLHTFDDGVDGAYPFSGVAIDRSGHVYGVTYAGGYKGGICSEGQVSGCGTVFKLQHRGSGWMFTTIYSFTPPPDGNFPAGVVIGRDGTLYGATYGGGINNGQGQCSLGNNGCGTVFNLRTFPTPCLTALCPWNETLLYRFSGMNGDGAVPYNGDLIFDSAGSIYGTTELAGANGTGVVYKLTPSPHGWSESILYSFTAGLSGWGYPQSGVIFDQTGNLYGTVVGNGGVYQLTRSQSGWTGNLIQSFTTCGDGCGTEGGLIMDGSGNLYGATTSYGPNGGGTVYELLAAQGWNVNLLYSFTGNSQLGGVGPADKLTMDAAGNLYGTTQAEGLGYGTVFKLTPSGGGWAYTNLYSFTGGADGAVPLGSVSLDDNGNLYGTTFAGGDLSKCLIEGRQTRGCGVVWEITP